MNAKLQYIVYPFTNHMKRLLTLGLMLLCLQAYSQDFKARWARILKLEQEGLVKQALLSTDSIYSLAESSRNEPQIVKAFLFRSKYLLITEEEAVPLIFSQLNKEKAKATLPTRALLESLYATMLSEFYGSKRYTYKSPSPVDLPIGQIEEWTARQFQQAIAKAWEQSLKNREALYKIPLDNYQQIIDFGAGSGVFRRSLYDFLAGRYLANSGNIYVRVDTSKLFGTTAAFLGLRLPPDTDSITNNKITLLQELERFYTTKKDTAHLYNSILRRLRFADDHYRAPDKNEPFLKTVTQLAEKWKGAYFTGQAQLMAASLYRRTADKTKNPDYLRKALAICESILVNRNDENNAAAYNLKNLILAKKVVLTAEKYVTAGRPSLAQVAFANTDSLTVRVIKVNRKEFEGFGSKPDTSITNKKKVYLEQVYQLPRKKDDYFEHTTEVMLPALPNGYYIADISSRDKFPETFRSIAFQATNTTITEPSGTSNNSYTIYDKDSGAPASKAHALYLGKKYEASKHGVVTFPLSNVSGDQEVLLINAPDTIAEKKYFYGYSTYKKSPIVKVRAAIYLDRAIYRPGSAVYFKTILTRQDGEKLSLVKDVYVSIELSGPSSQIIEERRIKIGAMGSADGMFNLPANGETGEYTIQVSEDHDYEEDDHPLWDDVHVNFRYSTVTFVVEEYKRPTFEVTLEKPKGDLIFGKELIVKGKAQTFSAAPISDSKVSYTISYASVNPRRYGSYSDNDENDQLSTGTVQTAADGSFSITFVPAKQPTKVEATTFLFRLSASVTDVRGEVRKGEIDMVIGANPLKASMSLDDQVTDTKHALMTLRAADLNDEPKQVKARIRIYRLPEQTTPKLQRPWGFPDVYSISKQEFEHNFPFYNYTSQDSLESGKIISDTIVRFSGRQDIKLPGLASDTGRYRVALEAEDELGNIATATQPFTVVKDFIPVAPGRVFSYKVTNTNFVKDGAIRLYIHSPLPELHMVVRYADLTGDQKLKYLVVKNNSFIKIPVKGPGEIIIQMEAVWQNRLFVEQQRFDLREKQKELIIEPISITNKLQPGSPVNWTFKITNGGKEQTELLATMYDTSLDAFATTRWNLPFIEKDQPYVSSEYLQLSGKVSQNFLSRFPVRQIPLFEDYLYLYGLRIDGMNKSFLYSRLRTPAFGKNTVAVRGEVTDSAGLPLPGVNVQFPGTVDGVQTDFDGRYSIHVPQGSNLEFNMVGMITKNVVVAGDRIDVVLEDDHNILEEVVVVGYGVTMRERYTGTATRAKHEAEYIFRQLQGEVAGVAVTGAPGSGPAISIRGVGSVNAQAKPLYVLDDTPVDGDVLLALNPDTVANIVILKDAAATSIYGSRGANGVIIVTTKKAIADKDALQQVKARKNFNETAFFYPKLMTDVQGGLSLSFTTPESLTTWKLRMLAHNDKAEFGYFENNFVAQKEVMVAPNMPRLLREGDSVQIIAKVTNLTDEAREGLAMLQLSDALSMNNYDMQMDNLANSKRVSLPAKGSATVSWKIKVPLGMQAVHYRVVAKAGNHTDGEENILPVLPNRIIVTESLPLWVKPNSTRSFTFTNLKDNASATLINQGITLQYNSNPVWGVIESLPYLMEYEHECAEQLFSRYYANSLAAYLLQSNPAIQKVFEKWRAKGGSVSKLEQNAELKSAIMSETPWVLDAADETTQNNRIALLFDLVKMKEGLDLALQKLKMKQTSSGGFAWFDGGKENPFITRHIIAGFGHLIKLGATPHTEELKEMMDKAVAYVDDLHLEKQANIPKPDRTILRPDELHYLYSRSFYIETVSPNDSLRALISKNILKLKRNWLSLNLYEKAMATLVLLRFGEKSSALKILNHLKETSSSNEEYGMYWIANKPGWQWNNAPVEVQAMLIEAFTEAGDTTSVDAMKAWLLRQKQKNSWPTTKATTEAIYALLVNGTNWMEPKGETKITIGKTQVDINNTDSTPLKMVWPGTVIKPDMATITISNNTPVPGYGGYYWQYFEDLDKVKENPQGLMNIRKEFYRKSTAPTGVVLEAITEDKVLKVGDVVTVRLVLSIKEDLEYVHLKDLRASAFEPIDVLSGNYYKNGLSYYQSTRDAATHFFFDRISKGSYMLEYDVTINNAGSFSGGLATLQSMYAPAFSAHSTGQHIKAAAME
jgi:TonB-dependent SusC/RagA subfamily outer membrane receptor